MRVILVVLKSLFVLGIFTFAGWYTYSLGHMRGERAGIAEMRKLYGHPPGHVLLSRMYFDAGDDTRPVITMREDKYGASEVVLEDWRCRRIPQEQ